MRQINHETYLQGNAVFYAAIWIVNVESLRWVAEYDSTSAEFSASFDVYSKADLVVSMSRLTSPASVTF